MKSLKKDVDIYLSDEILESKLREFQVYEIEYLSLYVRMYVCIWICKYVCIAAS